MTNLPAIELNDIEEEIVILKAVKEIIDSMVNYEVLDLVGSDPDSNILFHSSTHQRFFNIVLVDFLSCTDPRAPVQPRSYLGALRKITENPRFDVGSSVTLLRTATRDLVSWLEQTVEVSIWLPSMCIETELCLARVEFLKMCGNISKHNFLRAVGVAQELQGLLSKSGVPVELDVALLALADFYTRFHTDILNYHSSTIAEFLNNIRWGVYEYLQPQFRQSIVWESKDPPRYRYTYPPGVRARFAQECYWELMNEVWNPPHIRRFEVTKWLKLRYWVMTV